MRARHPDATGSVDRDGIKIWYEVYGTGEPVVLLLPSWAIVHSRLWKAQVAYLAQHYRVVTYDPRGHGRSDRPTDPSAYHVGTQAADAIAVLDAVGADRAVLVGHSFGTALAYVLSATHPERVLGTVFIGTTLNVDGRDDFPLARALVTFNEDHGIDEGWARYNRQSFLRDFPGFVRFFVGQAINDPHSTKPIEDAVGWGLETTPEVLAATLSDRVGALPAALAQRIRAMAPAVRCPSLVIHGTEDLIGPVHLGRSLAALLKAPLVELPGAGHCPQVRYPVQVNRLIRRFVDQVTAPPGGDVMATKAAGGATTPLADDATVNPTASVAPATLIRAVRSSAPRVLYLSSPIGLGHARRDLAIVTELRRQVPELQVDWLAQDPVTRVLAAAGERVHPASVRLSSESAHLESESCEHDLHVFQAMRRMDEILVANFMTFLDVIETDRYDLVVGDEAWDVDHFLHEDPTAKRARFAWLTDFVGHLPLPMGGEAERLLTADYNAEMIEHVERSPQIRDTAIFVGDPDDVVNLAFGAGLPNIREWTEEHYRFAGYITGYDPAEMADRTALRAELGYRPDETVVIAAVGGSGIGAPLLRRIVAAHPLAAEQLPGLRTILVTGPRLDPGSLPAADGVEKQAYVPDLHRHLAACDLAVVQGGLSTTMELTAARRPFLYVPLRNHFEQQIHVRHRLERYGAGRCIDFAEASAEQIALAMSEELHRPGDYRPVEGRGAQRAATMLAELL